MADKLIGQIIGGYEITRRLGQGGMATVYLARQTSMNRQVALKVLPRQFLNDDTYLNRFEQEVKIVSKLEHRNIVPVYNYGEHDEQPYIVMRYMSGGSVDDLLRENRGAIEQEKVLNILLQIAPALDYAHTKNVLHRDLKPSNILLDDDEGAFLTDFGIARILGEQNANITTTGVVGTPSYMSPEQAQGHNLDGRSDVYSLGIVLFEMLTGRRPFESDTPYSIAVMQVTQDPPAPRSFNQNVSLPVERVVLKALKKKPEERYQNATTLAQELKDAIEKPETFRDTEPIQVTPEPEPIPVAVPQDPRPAPVPDAGSPKTPASSGLLQQPVFVPQKKKETSNLWFLIFGGTIGCGLLILILVVFILAIGSLGTQITSVPTSDLAEISSDSTPLPPLDSTSEAIRATLLPLSTNLGATQTSEAGQSSTTATESSVVLSSNDQNNVPVVDINPGGEIIFAAQRGTNNKFEIVKMDIETLSETLLTTDNSDNSYPVPSPDGRWIAFQSDRDGDWDIYIMSQDGRQVRQLTVNDYWDRLPAWSADGDWIIYSSDVRGDGTFDIYKIRVDGTDNELVISNGQRNSHPRWADDDQVYFTGGEIPGSDTWEIYSLDINDPADVVNITNNDIPDKSPTLSPTGDKILYSTFEDDDYAIGMINLDGSEREIIFNSEGTDWAASFSPDGNFIIVTSTIDGEDQLFLISSDGSNVQQLTQNGGAYASWIPTSISQ